MAFPSSPRDVVAELFVGGSWVDLTALGHVYTRDRISITRGRKNEGARPEPSSCALTLNNSTGNYSPRNPAGAYYGTLTRNTPLRLAVRTVTDAFTRTVSNGWGSTDTGQAWSVVGAGGSVLASDWNVGSGVGTQSVPVANAYRVSYLATELHRDVDVAVTVSLPFTNVTGAGVEPGSILLRGQSVTDYLLVKVTVTTAEAVTIEIDHYDGTVLAAAVTVAGLTHTSSQALRVRAQAEGHTIRAKVWPAAGSEPYGWHITAHTERITSPGWVGVRTGVANGNTNTKPVVASYDGFEVRLPRFAGEVSSWPQRWDLSGNDRYVPIMAAGIGRRLGQGSSALQSALRRGILSDAIATPVAYWPAEEAAGASQIASGLPGGNSMFVRLGTPTFAANTDFDCSDPLPQPKDSYWSGQVPAHTVAGRVQVRFLLSVPPAGITGQSLVAIGTTGSISTWLVVVDASGNLALRAFNRAGTSVFDSGFLAYGVNGSPLWMSVEYEQVGSAVECNLVTLRPGAATGSQLPFSSIASQTVGLTQFVQIGSIGDCGVGHISVHNVWSSLFALGSQLNAWKGETAGDRIERLCGDEGIPFAYVGDLADTAAMGAQKSKTVLTLLQESADADLGTLVESRGELGLSYRTRTSLYNQDAALGLDYSAGHISPPFEPTDDDQLTVNDVEAKRTDGSSARAVQETGPMSVLAPEDGGIGRYDTSAEVNVQTDDQLADVAGWLLALGVVDEARYPSVTVHLSTPGVLSDGLEPQVLDVNVDDRITIDTLPAGQPPGQVSQLARGYAESIGPFEHRLTFNCSPESPYQVGVLDSSGRLDSATSTVAVGFDAALNSFTVATTDPGDLWITTAANPGEFPLPVTIGGEDMLVGAISGATSPQTFSLVTRSVNNVIKSHVAGEEVHVTDPLILAL